MKTAIALSFLLISNLASAKYYCINHRGIIFSISIPDEKDLKDVVFVSEFQLYFNETIILFSNNPQLSNHGIDAALSILAYLLENSITTLEDFMPINVLDSNSISFLYSNYPLISINSYGATTFINSGQHLSFIPLENLTEANTADDNLSNVIEENPLTSDGIVASYPCLYDCGNKAFTNTWSRTQHHRKKHSGPLAKINLLLKDGLFCPTCNKIIITYNQLAQHLRYHGFKSYFQFLGKHLQP